MRATVGVSCLAAPIRAAWEASRAALVGAQTIPELALVFVSGAHASDASAADVLATVAEVTSADQVLGASGAGVLSASGEMEGDAVGVALIWEAGARVASAGNLGRDSDRACALAVRDLDLSAEGVLLLLFDARTVTPSLTAALHRQVPVQVPVLGMGAIHRSGAAWVAPSAEEPQDDAIVALWLRQASARWTVATVGRPLSPYLPVSHAVGGVIHTLQDRRALDVLMETVRGPLMTDLERLGLSIFVGLSVPGGVEILRPLLGMDPLSGAIAIGGAPLFPGQRVRFLLRDPDTARHNLQDALASLQDQMPSPALLLVARATGRGAELYGDLAGIEAALIANAFPKTPLLGLMDACELTPAADGFVLHLYTTTLIALR